MSGKAFENEYISRREAIKARKRSCDKNYRECDFAIEGDSWCEVEVFVVDIIRIPPADVRHVVLCRDCIYAPTGNQDGADLEWPCDDFPERNPCPFKCEDKWYSRKPSPDFFCANGAKRSRNE